ncbi:MAG: hypothetical protein KDJ15_07205 [Alphaproteobacteria bacterium]|nr:hypothetical protein [Alphaproteobacteria bacterium]
MADETKKESVRNLAFINATLSVGMTATDPNTRMRMMNAVERYTSQVEKIDGEGTKLCESMSAKITALALHEKDAALREKAQEILADMIRSDKFPVNTDKLLDSVKKRVGQINGNSPDPEAQLQFLTILLVVAEKGPCYGEKISEILRQVQPVNADILKEVDATFRNIQNVHLAGQVEELERMEIPGKKMQP